MFLPWEVLMQHPRRTAALLFTAILGAAACSSGAAILTQPSAPAGAPLAAKATVQKFTFTNVTFSDGVVGDIQAGSKHNNKSDFTVCDYFTPGGVDYLGQFQSDNFSSSNRTEVQSFCLDHYVDRQ
jgi:hypothetical protein